MRADGWLGDFATEDWDKVQAWQRRSGRRGDHVGGISLCLEDGVLKLFLFFLFGGYRSP